MLSSLPPFCVSLLQFYCRHCHFITAGKKVRLSLIFSLFLPNNSGIPSKIRWGGRFPSLGVVFVLVPFHDRDLTGISPRSDKNTNHGWHYNELKKFPVSWILGHTASLNSLNQQFSPGHIVILGIIFTLHRMKPHAPPLVWPLIQTLKEIF